LSFARFFLFSLLANVGRSMHCLSEFCKQEEWTTGCLGGVAPREGTLLRVAFLGRSKAQIRRLGMPKTTIGSKIEGKISEVFNWRADQRFLPAVKISV